MHVYGCACIWGCVYVCTHCERYGQNWSSLVHSLSWTGTHCRITGQTRFLFHPITLTPLRGQCQVGSQQPSSHTPGGTEQGSRKVLTQWRLLCVSSGGGAAKLDHSGVVGVC